MSVNEYKPYVGDVGTIIEIDMQEDISAETYKMLLVKKPDGTNKEWTPTVSGSQKLRYIVQAGDFNKKGKYIIQPKLTLGTWTGRGDTVVFTVYDEWE